MAARFDRTFATILSVALSALNACYFELSRPSRLLKNPRAKAGCVPEGQDDGSLARSAWNREVVSPSRRARCEAMAIELRLV